MDRTEFLILAKKVAYGQASQEELSLYNACLEELQRQRDADEDYTFSSDDQTELWQNIQSSIEPKPSGNWFLKNYKYAAAAMVVLTLSAGLYFSYHNNEKVKPKQMLSQVITPGGNKAILTLADGKKITLKDKNEEIILTGQQSSVWVKKNGELVYDKKSTQVLNEAPQYHKIETPMGGRFQLSLPDGSKIILNSASSLKYPVVFGAGERVVELSGEAYFEVAKDALKPFKVNSGKQQVQVLGTQFNINSYADEGKISTTLVEGSVKVGLNKGKDKYMLKPGQQSVLTGDNFEVKSVNIKEFVAWKDGEF